MACLIEDIKTASICKGTLWGRGEASFYSNVFFFFSTSTHMVINQAWRSEGRSAASSWLATKSADWPQPGREEWKVPISDWVGPSRTSRLHVIDWWVWRCCGEVKGCLRARAIFSETVGVFLPPPSPLVLPQPLIQICIMNSCVCIWQIVVVVVVVSVATLTESQTHSRGRESPT